MSAFAQSLPPCPLADRRELDHRRIEGIDVWLLWSQREDRVSVTIFDSRSARASELEVMPGDSALDVFRHPCAYALSRDPGEHRRRWRRRLRATIQQPAGDAQAGITLLTAGP